MTDQNMVEEIARLRAENEALKAKTKTNANSNPEGLPILTEYDPTLFMTASDVADKVSFPNLKKVSKPEAATVIKVFGLEPQAQYRPATQTKGRGSQLFLKAEVDELVKHVAGFRG